MNSTFHWDDEWLEADGLGGFSSGTVSGRRTRRYHALLLAATTPPTGRFVLVNGIETSVESNGKSYPISSQFYAPNVVHPDGDLRRESFEREPWPTWVFRLENGVRIEQELFVPHERAAVAMRWRLLEPADAVASSAGEPVWLAVRPLLSGRDYHSLHHENPAFRFDAAVADTCLTWRPYEGVPGIAVFANADYRHAPLWYRSFLYQCEAERGLDATEDLASPGEFRWNLSAGEAIWIVAAEGLAMPRIETTADAADVYRPLRAAEQQRRIQLGTPLDRAADSYIVRRGIGRTIVAGYPWFTDWGRDTFIAMRGLCIATDRLDVAREILLAWSGVVSEGMLPNRFPDQGDAPEFNSVDASLWYVVAVHEYLSALIARGEPPNQSSSRHLLSAVQSILDGYIRGTRFRIQVTDDGLLAAGQSGVQLTWMDAKVGDWIVTPRIGKPVELQALWFNALWIAQQWIPNGGPWRSLLGRGQESFLQRFWDADRGHLLDVVDIDHEPGRIDPTLRPNQILAVGGLPISLLFGERARRIVDIVEQKLWTPLGLRTLSPDDPAYCPRYEGDVRQRDGAYHQGTVWPWLTGPFVAAWLHAHGNTPATRQIARERFLQPLHDQLRLAGLGHVSEIADAEPPHTPRGCPFQAWSLGELLRLDRVILADSADSISRAAASMTPELAEAIHGGEPLPPFLPSDRLANEARPPYCGR